MEGVLEGVWWLPGAARGVAAELVGGSAVMNEADESERLACICIYRQFPYKHAIENIKFSGHAMRAG